MAELKIPSDVGGTVVRIECVQGAALADGDVILIVESMKMEIPIEAPAAGTVVALLVAVGDTVEEGQHVVVVQTL